MEINFNTFNLLDSIIYRANIFNYDNKFLSIVREINSPMKIKYEGNIRKKTKGKNYFSYLMLI